MAYENGLIAEILVDAHDFMGQVTLDVLLEESKKTSELIFITVKTLEEAYKLAHEITQKHKTVLP